MNKIGQKQDYIINTSMDSWTLMISKLSGLIYDNERIITTTSHIGMKTVILF